jgi:hypothetical protein
MYTATTYTTVSGNNIIDAGPGSIGGFWAIAFLSGSNHCTCTGNTIGIGGWNGNSTSTIFSDSSNTVASNNGDTFVARGAGPATITSGTWLAWYKADAITSPGDGNPIVTWPDSSGLTANLVPYITGSSAAPTYILADGTTTKPAVAFAGVANASTGQALKCTTQPLFHNAPITMWIVAKQTATDGNTRRLFADGQDNGIYYVGGSAFARNNTQIGGASGDTAVSNWKITTYRYLGTAASTLQVGTGTVVTGNAGSAGLFGTINSVNLVIGTKFDAGFDFFNGRIAEVVIAMGNVSSTDRTTVYNALKTKYGLPT